MEQSTLDFIHAFTWGVITCAAFLGSLAAWFMHREYKAMTQDQDEGEA